MSSISSDVLEAELLGEDSATTVEGSSIHERVPLSKGQRLARLVRILTVVAIVILADLTIYRGAGFFGLAVAFVVIIPLLMVGVFPPKRMLASIGIAMLLLLVSAKLLFLGSVETVVAGFALVVAFCLSLHGCRVFVIEGIVYGLQLAGAGIQTIHETRIPRSSRLASLSSRQTLGFIVPLMGAILFGGLFLLANPDPLQWFLQTVTRVFTEVVNWILSINVMPDEMLFWVAAALIATGMLRPASSWFLKWLSVNEITEQEAGRVQQQKSVWYLACRNLLITVNILFAVYLLFEFQSLWFREFPDGFHYSGYAHQGAFWLTVALAFATATLSLIFPGHVSKEKSVAWLRRLAWTWCALNLLLALAVYHRLMIYVDFNGLTRLRIVGFLGISAVVLGFSLVVLKIMLGRNFTWLVRRQLQSLCLCGFLFIVLPVDWIAMRYNVRRVQDGDSAPAVQFCVQEFDDAGLLAVLPLANHEDERVRAGVRAIIARKAEAWNILRYERARAGWTATQLVDSVVERKLDDAMMSWDSVPSVEEQQFEIDAFTEYTYQWY